MQLSPIRLGDPHEEAHMIRRITRMAAALALTALIAPTASAQSAGARQQGTVTVPDTPAGRALSAWLEAFNSGDSVRMDAYYKRYEPNKSAESQMPFRRQTGGFDLVSIE